MENDNMNRIQRVSFKFRLLFTGLMYVIPLLTLVYWLFFNHLPAGFTTGLPVTIESTLTLTTRMLAFLVCMIPGTVAVYGLINLKNLFRLYEQGIVFSGQNVIYFRRLGYTLMAWVLAQLVFVILSSIVLTFHAVPGERMVVAQLGIADIGTLIIAAVVVLVSWVMNEAVKIEQEQALTV